MMAARTGRARWWVLAVAVWGGLTGLARGQEDGGGPSKRADTLHLTWRGDPTTTMAVQWVEQGVVPPVAPGHEAAWPAIDLPRVNADDDTVAWWGDQGLELGFLADVQDQKPDPADSDARAYVGWNDAGLLVWVRVWDDQPAEAAQDKLWEGDSVELFVGVDGDPTRRYQVIVSPGLEPDGAQPQWMFYGPIADKRRDELTLSVERTIHEDGCSLMLQLPWSNLGLTPVAGDVLRFQLMVNDLDRRPEGKGSRRSLVWYPSSATSREPEHAQRVRLTGPGHARASLRARVVIDESRRATLRIAAPAEYDGQAVAICSGDVMLQSATLARDGAVARARHMLPDPPAGARWGGLLLQLPDGAVAATQVPPTLGAIAPRPRTLQWSARGDEAWTDAVTTVTPFIGPFNWFVHRVELTGLTPDSTYRLRVLGDEGGEVMHFLTAPATHDRPLRFVIGGDVGVGERPVGTHQAAAAADPLFAIIGGDLSYADGVKVERKIQYLREWHQHMRGPDNRLIPHVATIGNHEVRGGYHGTTQHAPFFYSLFATRPYSTLDLGDYLSIVLLDSDHTASITGEQTTWLEQTLASRRHVPHVFPVYHVPAYPSYRPFDGEVSRRVREHWVPLFEQYGIRMAFENHDHTYKRTHPLRGGQIDAAQGILYLGDGAWGIGTRTPDPSRWYLQKTEAVDHCMLVVLDGGERRVTVLGHGGAVIDEIGAEVAAAASVQDR